MQQPMKELVSDQATERVAERGPEKVMGLVIKETGHSAGADCEYYRPKWIAPDSGRWVEENGVAGLVECI